MIKDPKKYEDMKSNVARMGMQVAPASHIKVTAAGEKVISSSNDLNK